eukprot:7146808-Pyramimonas_sp.AAC.1
MEAVTWTPLVDGVRGLDWDSTGSRKISSAEVRAGPFRARRDMACAHESGERGGPRRRWQEARRT